MDLEQVSAQSQSPAERREHIAERALREGSVSAKSLAGEFGVSMMTIYRDLDELEQRRIVRRERGGATAQPSSLFESDVRYRILRSKVEKDALCERALQEIEPGQAVMVDDSTTVLPLVYKLPALVPLTLITNFRVALEESMDVKGLQVTSLGGDYLSSHDAYVGLVCEAAISAVRPDVFFMSTSSVSEGGAFHQEPEMVRIKRAMLRAARRGVLLVDHGKFHNKAVNHLASLREFDLVLTDDGAPAEAIADLDDHGVRYEVVSTAQPIQ